MKLSRWPGAISHLLVWPTTRGCCEEQYDLICALNSVEEAGETDAINKDMEDESHEKMVGNQYV